MVFQQFATTNLVQKALQLSGCGGNPTTPAALLTYLLMSGDSVYVSGKTAFVIAINKDGSPDNYANHSQTSMRWLQKAYMGGFVYRFARLHGADRLERSCKGM